jgi:8-oxo-dGTP diphosphatase
VKARLLRAALAIGKEAARHLLRRPVVGVAIAARVPDGRWLLIRRGDSGQWALPGGTLEWGEELGQAARRELFEEAGSHLQGTPELCGVYSRPDRDPRFHAVTVLVRAEAGEPETAPVNPLEIREVRLFSESELPERLGCGMSDMLRDVRTGRRVLE